MHVLYALRTQLEILSASYCHCILRVSVVAVYLLLLRNYQLNRIAQLDFSRLGLWSRVVDADALRVARFGREAKSGRGPVADKRSS